MTAARFRFLQTGDLHVGRGRASWGEAAALRRAEKIFDDLYAAAHEQKCLAMLICGDVFDAQHVTNAERELVSRKLAQGSLEMPTYVIPGNHDQKSKGNSNLDFLAEITERSQQIPNLHVAFTKEVSVWPAPVGDMSGGLFIVGAPAPLSDDQAWVESWAASLPSDGSTYIFMGHGTVKGCARNDSLWRPDGALDKGLSLARAGTASQVVWWAYGDIHIRQQLPTLPPGANGWYAGSPVQMDFGETPDRGALVIALDWQDGWKYKGRKYIRLDDKGATPLVTVSSEDQIDALPKDVFIKLAKGLILPSERHAQVVKLLNIVEDHSTPAGAISSAVATTRDIGDGDLSLEAFDPLLADLSVVESEVLSGLPDQMDARVRDEAQKIVELAVERYRERVYVS